MKKRYPYCKFTISVEKEIVKEYISGSSMAALGKKYKCDPTTIKNLLRTYKVESRNLSQARRNYLKSTINEDSFKEINTPESAYWLGVMYSDGFISKANKYTNYFGIAVKSSDKIWLESFKDFLQYNGKIKTYKTGKSSYKPQTEYVRLLIGNNNIVSNLEYWGVTEHKTQKINSLPNINFLDDFIRGYIDGDGSLVKRLPNITICGNKDFLLDIAKYFDLNYSLYEDRTIYDLKYNKSESEYLEKRLYKDATCFLPRKREIAQRSFNSPLTLEDVRKKSE